MLLEDKKAEAKAEAVLILLNDIGTVPKELECRIKDEYDMDTLTKYLRLAARSSSITQFLEQMEKES